MFCRRYTLLRQERIPRPLNRAPYLRVPGLTRIDNRKPGRLVIVSAVKLSGFRNSVKLPIEGRITSRADLSVWRRRGQDAARELTAPARNRRGAATCRDDSERYGPDQRDRPERFHSAPP